MPRRLKVYEARIGFFDTVVAASSQAAALAAWGVHQNLFAGGEARLSEDAAAAEAALADPGTPLMRPAGSNDAFRRKPEAPAVPASKPQSGKRAKGVAANARSTPKRPPDRSAVTAAERRLERVSDDEAREKADLERRRRALDDEARSASLRWAKARKGAQAALERARRAFLAAGGKL